MKKLCLAFLFLPLCTLAQDCKLRKQKDQFSQELKFSTGFISLDSGFNHALVSIDADSKEIDFMFSLDGRCFDNSSIVTFIFEGARIKSNFKNSGSMNCEGLCHVTFRNIGSTPSNLNQLATKKVISIRFAENNKKFSDIFLKESQKLLLMNMASCIIKEGKTLIK